MSKWFKREEFSCPCCGENLVKASLIDKLDVAREQAGVPFVITSGYRCPKHNEDVGGVPNSSHTRGYAADIKVNGSRDRFAVVQGLVIAGFNRIGVSSGFVHADIDPDSPPDVLWTY